MLEHRKFLTIAYKDKFFEMTCLPQGTTCSPRIFVCLVSVIVKYLWKCMITLSFYFDDGILIAKNIQEMKRNLEVTIHNLCSTSFILNIEKSQLQATTQIEFLGFLLDSEKYTISLIVRKREKILSMVRDILRNPQKLITRRTISKIIGVLVATYPCSNHAQLLYRVLDRFKVKMLNIHNNKWNKKVRITNSCLQELRWWEENVMGKALEKSLEFPQVNGHIYTDASKDAYGSHFRDLHFQSRFTEKQAKLLSDHEGHGH